jgi:hypothetical protein
MNVSHRIRQWQKIDRSHLYYRFKDLAKQNPEKSFLVFEGKEYSFRSIEKGNYFSGKICSANKISN